jgi:ketosteroid isomerase-like protein
MSQENVEIVKRVQPSGVDLAALFHASTLPDPLATGVDLSAFASDFETEFVAQHAISMTPPVARGLQGFVDGWRDWLEPWESYYVEAEEFIDAGDVVVSLSRVRARSARDSAPVEHRPAALWTVREGRIIRVRFYLEREEGLEAAGLPE